MRIFGFAGWSGSGKTTLIEALIPRFVERRMTVSLIKHAHHAFDIDQPGKDSYRHRIAGCAEVLVSSRTRWALINERRGAAELTLYQAIAHLSPCDLVLVEGYKRATIPKLEVWREAVGKPPLHPDDSAIVAVAAAPIGGLATRLPVFGLNDVDAIATFIGERAAGWPFVD